MRIIRTEEDLADAIFAASSLPPPTQAAMEDINGFRFVTLRDGEFLQWGMVEGSGYMSGMTFGVKVKLSP